MQAINQSSSSISTLWILVTGCWVSTDRMLIYLIQSTKMELNRWSMKTTQWLPIAYLQGQWLLIFRSTSNQCVMQYCITESPPRNLSQNTLFNSNSLSCVNRALVIINNCMEALMLKCMLNHFYISDNDFISWSIDLLYIIELPSVLQVIDRHPWKYLQKKNYICIWLLSKDVSVDRSVDIMYDINSISHDTE